MKGQNRYQDYFVEMYKKGKKVEMKESVIQVVKYGSYGCLWYMCVLEILFSWSIECMILYMIDY